MASRPAGEPGRWRRSSFWRLLKGTVGACMQYRVTGLAAEAAFYAVLSLPPLIFGLAGSIGYVVGIFGPETVADVRVGIVGLARKGLTESSVQNVILPTLDTVLDKGRADVVSIGFVLALWSGSRALNVFIDTITIMYGLGGRRGIVKTRILSFSLYVIALAIGVVVLPLVLVGPHLVGDLLPDRIGFLGTLYWPIVVVLSVGCIATIYHLSVPVRTPWRTELPGAALVLTIWILGSFALRLMLSIASGGTSIYGPLAAPIAVLLWLYVISIAVLIGAALNAAVDQVWPSSATAAAREAPRLTGWARWQARRRRRAPGATRARERGRHRAEPAAASSTPPAAPAAAGPPLGPAEPASPSIARGGRRRAAETGGLPAAGVPSVLAAPATASRPGPDGGAAAELPPDHGHEGSG